MRIIWSAVLIAVAVAVSVAGCRRKAPSEPPLAKPSIALSRNKAPLGSPIEVTYRFEVEPNPPSIKEDYKVFVAVVDSDGEIMWQDDHDPSVPTTQWRPGQKIEYTRTVFIPPYPYLGDATIRMGLYSTSTQKRVALSGDDMGKLAYRVGKIELRPQTENLFTVYKDGWHSPEVPAGDPHAEWQWTKKKEATLAFKNPKKDSTFYLDLDNPGTIFPEGQHVEVRLKDKNVTDFTLQPVTRVFHKIPLSAAQLGSDDMVDLTIAVDKTFVPADLPGSTNKDPRELGVRVFHAFVQPVQ